jgi:hypothetical protein
MTRRRLLWAGVVLLVLLSVAGLGWLLVPPDPASQMRSSMTLKEVEALFGKPPDDGECETEECCEWIWSTGTGVVEVTTDENDVVLAVQPRPTTFFDRLRTWLGW